MIPAPVKAHAVELLKAGTSVEEVQRTCGISRTTITALRVAHGITFRNKSGSRPHLKHVTRHQREVERLRTMGPLIEQGWSILDPAKRRGWFLTLSKTGKPPASAA